MKGTVYHNEFCCYCNRVVTDATIAQKVYGLTGQRTFMCVNHNDCMAAIAMGQIFDTLTW